jgi:hypothetical protein
MQNYLYMMIYLVNLTLIPKAQRNVRCIYPWA